MNYKQFLLVGFVVAIAGFSFYHLSNAGSDYRFLTTSDSGYFYGIAEDIDQEGGMIDVYARSHPPQGRAIPKGQQFQPLLLTAMYRGLNAVDPGISLMVVSQYFSPFLFALAVIGAFLAARELGGDLAACASSLFMATLVGSVYWTKIGAFDREITLIFFGTWLFYLMAKIFKAQKMEILKYSVLAGLFYGLFLITWSGAPFLAVIFGFALFLVIAEKVVSGGGLIITSIIFFMLGNNFEGIGNIPTVIGVFVFLVGLVKLSRDWDSLKNIEGSIVSGFKENSWLITGIVLVFVVSTAVTMALGGQSFDFLINIFGERLPGFIGLGGGGGVSWPTFATEQAGAASSLEGYFSDLGSQLYRNSLLNGITLFLAVLGAIKIFWDSKKSYLMILAWVIIILPMPISQSRFFRLFWVMWPVLAGFGFSALLWMFRKVGRSPSFSSLDWINKFRKPLILALVCVILIVPFIQNVRADHNASNTRPTPHGGSLPTNSYHSLLDSFNWIEENTPEDSVLAIPWSYGHFATGATDRPSLTDGAQTAGWRGEWRDSSGIVPPDYIRYTSGDEGYIIGVSEEAPAEPYQINGRRIDIQRMLKTSDENEFAWLVNAYKENFDIGMDYMIFNNSLSGAGTAFEQVLYSIGENFTRADSVGGEGDSEFIFEFENENIVFNFRGHPVTQGENEDLGGYIIYNSSTGRLFNSQHLSIPPFSLNTSPEKSKLLWIFLNNQGSIEGGGIVNFEGMKSIPMLIRSLGGYDMPDYLKQVYHSPRGQAEVYKIVHDNIPKYLPNE